MKGVNEGGELCLSACQPLKQDPGMEEQHCREARAEGRRTAGGHHMALTCLGSALAWMHRRPVSS